MLKGIVHDVTWGPVFRECVADSPSYTWTNAVFGVLDTFQGTVTVAQLCNGTVDDEGWMERLVARAIIVGCPYGKGLAVRVGDDQFASYMADAGLGVL